MNILASASRIVFIVITLSLCIFTYKWIIDPKDFMILASSVFSFYFTKKDSNDWQQK